MSGITIWRRFPQREERQAEILNTSVT